MRLLRRLYDWVLRWANTPYGVPVLFLLAFAESSFFPIPPDVLLVALALGVPTRAFRYATVASIGSVLGGALGYGIGLGFWDTLGDLFLNMFPCSVHKGLPKFNTCFLHTISGSFSPQVSRRSLTKFLPSVPAYFT
jgi:hypothetical protein